MQKYSLILPVNGQSTRFPNMRPKWLLTHPSGNCMLLASILGISLKNINNIYIITNKDHVKQYQFINGLKKQFGRHKINPKFIILNGKTSSQIETIKLSIDKQNIHGPIAIKDCDNYFTTDLKKIENCIYTYSLNNIELINPSNKCYVKVDNIKEKDVISDKFGCGLYTFVDTKIFLDNSYKTKFLSEIFNNLIQKNISVNTRIVGNYLDWGTKEDWIRYCQKYNVYFMDIDGILMENSCEYMTPYWGTSKGIQSNINTINNLYNSGFNQIILTTSRHKYYDKITKKQLKKMNIRYHHLIFGLYHGKRIVVNDFNNTTNKYPSAKAINFPRNDNNLQDYIEQ
jgi:hypothetical protein